MSMNTSETMCPAVSHAKAKKKRPCLPFPIAKCLWLVLDLLCGFGNKTWQPWLMILAHLYVAWTKLCPLSGWTVCWMTNVMLEQLKTLLACFCTMHDFWALLWLAVEAERLGGQVVCLKVSLTDWSSCTLLYLMMCLNISSPIFLPICSLPISTHHPVRPYEKSESNKCFLWEAWNQTVASLHTTAHAALWGSETHYEESALCPIPRSWVYRHPGQWLVGVIVTDKGESLL